MIKVNTKTLTASREAIPQALQGLSAGTLRNLQTELNPVPEEFKDIEYWEEIDITPVIDFTTQVPLHTETLEVDKVTKTVKVVRGVRAKTAEELLVERKALVPISITNAQARLMLIDLGQEEAIDAYVQNSSDKKLKVMWEYETIIRRDNESLIAAVTTLGWTEEQLDEMFITANRL